MKYVVNFTDTQYKTSSLSEWKMYLAGRCIAVISRRQGCDETCCLKHDNIQRESL